MRRLSTLLVAVLTVATLVTVAEPAGESSSVPASAAHGPVNQVNLLEGEPPLPGRGGEDHGGGATCCAFF